MVDPEDALAPDTPDCTTVHAKVVPATGLLSDTEEAVDEHIAWLAGVAVAAGIGFTVITTVMGAPVKPFADGVIV